MSGQQGPMPRAIITLPLIGVSIQPVKNGYLLMVQAKGHGTIYVEKDPKEALRNAARALCVGLRNLLENADREVALENYGPEDLVADVVHMLEPVTPVESSELDVT